MSQLETILQWVHTSEGADGGVVGQTAAIFKLHLDLNSTQLCDSIFHSCDAVAVCPQTVSQKQTSTITLGPSRTVSCMMTHTHRLTRPNNTRHTLSLLVIQIFLIVFWDLSFTFFFQVATSNLAWASVAIHQVQVSRRPQRCTLCHCNTSVKRTDRPIYYDLE